MNPWKRLLSKELKEQMALAGCEEKYIDGSTSDFESFRELCRIMPLLRGNEQECRFLNLFVELTGEDIGTSDVGYFSARGLWKRLCAADGECLCCGSYTDENYNNNIIPFDENIAVEKSDFPKDVLTLNEQLDSFEGEYCEFVDYLVNMLENKSRNGVFVCFDSSPFERPNAYRAEMIFNKIHNGEKYNISDKNLLFCQILCEIIYKKTKGILQLIIDYGEAEDNVEDIIKYLVMRNLKARIYLRVTVDTPVEKIKSACLGGNCDCFVTPLLSPEFKNSDDKKRRSFIDLLSWVYPAGLIL